MLNYSFTTLSLCLILLIFSPELLFGKRAYPHHVAISVLKGWGIFQSGHICSGSIIAENWILTLASCLKKDNTITVNYGSNFFDQGTEVEGKKFLRRYNYVHDFYDFALIKVDKMIFDDNTKAISLPKKSFKQVNMQEKRCMFTGWADGKEIYKGLALGEVTIRNRENCVLNYQTELCGNFSLGSQSVTNSGSPLVYESLEGRILIGIFERNLNGVACFIPLTEPHFLEWIEAQTGLFLA